MATNHDKIKTIITEEVESFEQKNVARHAKERIDSRLNKMASRGDLSPVEVQTISGNLDKVINHLGKFEENKSYGIRLGRFHVNPESKTIEKPGEAFVVPDRGRVYYRIWGDSADRKDLLATDSTGNEMWAVVRNNTLVTMFLRKDYQRAAALEKRLQGSGGLGVEDVIDNFDEFLATGGKTKMETKKDAGIQQGKDRKAEAEKLARKIIRIDGVNWVINDDGNRIHKKNNPDTFVLYDDILDYPHWDDETKMDILDRFG